MSRPRTARRATTVQAMSEGSDRLTTMIQGFDARVQAASPDSWTNQSPCADWKARDVVLHVSNNFINIAAGLTDGEPQPVADDEDIVAAWTRASEGIVSAMATGDMNKMLPSPMGPMPAEMFIGRLISTDVLVHTWDLARAVGGDDRLDQDAVGHAYEGLKPMDAMIRMPGVFGPKVAAPADADIQAEFLSFLGRQV